MFDDGEYLLLPIFRKTNKMRIVVTYTMKAYIEADNIDDCTDIWLKTDIAMDKEYQNGVIHTEYGQLQDIMDLDKMEEISLKL